MKLERMRSTKEKTKNWRMKNMMKKMTMSTEMRRIRIILSREFPRIIQMGMGLNLRGVTEEGHKNNIRMKVMKRRMMRMSQSQGTV